MPDKLPPGPRLPRLVQAAVFLHYWPRFVAACRRRYGSVFTLRMSGLGTVVYLDDPADIKVVFAGDPALYHAGEANSVLAGLLGRSSVLVIDEDVHKYRRRLMLAPFQQKAVAGHVGLMADIAANNTAKWPVGKEFPVSSRMSEITLEVILRIVVGATDPTRLAELRAVLRRLLTVNSWNVIAFAKPKLQQRLPWRSVRHQLATADRLLYAEIAERRADPYLAERTDALAMLIRATDEDGRSMSDRELRDQLITLLVAGHDTTATGLSWAVERLTRHPDILAKAVAAADASATGDPAADEYLDAVCKETLRIRPVVFDVGRILTRPVEFGGYHLPAGVMVAPGVGLVHADPAVYPDPDRFDPDRMVGATLSPTTWLPFGGGNRRCLGATFALTEMRVVLRQILLDVELETTTARDEGQHVKHVILTPSRGARIRVRARRQLSASNSVSASSRAVTAMP